MLKRLEPLAPAMRNCLLLDMVDSEYSPVAEVASEMTEFVERNVVTDDEDEPSPEDGYCVPIMGSQEPTECGHSGAIDISITAGSTWSNHFDFQIGDSRLHPNDFSLITYPIFRGAIEALAASWPCPWAIACAYGRDMPRAGGHPKRRPSPFDIAWIGCLSAPRAVGLTAPSEVRIDARPAAA